MFRMRRYRLFLIVALAATLMVWHLGKVRHWEVPNVEGFAKFGIKQTSTSLPKLDMPTPIPTAIRTAVSDVKFPVPQSTSSPSPVAATSAVHPADVLKDAAFTSLKKASTPSLSKPILPTRTSKSRPPTFEEEEAAVGEELLEEFGQHGVGRLEFDQHPLNHAQAHWEAQIEKFPVPRDKLILLPNGQGKVLPKIQHDFEQESEIQKAGRIQKLDAVKEAFKHAWAGYKNNAMPHDELNPLTGGYTDPFNGWGATLVDTLDTLWIMGLKDEFEAAVVVVKNIDFKTTPRKDVPLFETTIRYLGGLLSAHDLSSGKYPVLLEKAVELGEVLMGAFDTPNRMPVTYYYWAPSYASQPHRAGTRVVLAELGSLSMEFTRLAQITKEQKYYDAVARITDALEEWQMKTALPGLWPTKLDASGCKKPEHPVQIASPLSFDEFTGKAKEKTPLENTAGSLNKRQLDDAPAKIAGTSLDAKLPEADKKLQISSPSMIIPDADNGVDCDVQGLAEEPHTTRQTFGIGGQADSTYEYFPKEYLLLGGQVDKYRTMYENSASTIKNELLFRPMTQEGKDILFVGKVDLTKQTGTKYERNMIYEGTHLSCFAGGMFAFGAKAFGLEDDLVIARKLTEGCIWAYESTATGIMPEEFTLIPCESRNQCEWNETKWHEVLDPNHQQRIDEANAFIEKQRAYLEQSAKLKEDFGAAAVSVNPPMPTLPDTENKVLRRRQVEDSDTLKPKSDEKRQPLETPSPTTSSKEPDLLVSVDSPAVIYEPKGPLSHEEFVAARIREERLPPGYSNIRSRQYGLRPEAIESVWIMYRLTGEDYWRQKGWQMFQAIQSYTWTELGNSMISDVTLEVPVLKDNMESFWLAETLKYFYLLFSDSDLISLDDYVLNTEAHPFTRPKTNS